MLKLFNTLSRRLELFKPLKSKKVGIYSCGPTVYNYVHIGNLRAYVFTDLLKRYLHYRGFSIKHVMNITDVDDKTIRDSKKNNKSLNEFTDFYLKAFLKDLKSMNIKLPDIMPRATEHISEMVDLIEKLKKKGNAYRKNNSIYYKISKFKNYGALAQLSKQLLKKNASHRLSLKDEYEKDQANDFVLWKTWQPKDDNVYWDTRIGRGRPGWHIECSAMSMRYLGETFDIHCGGVDLIFPHHTNEIAQSEAATGKKFVKYWLHNAHLMVNGKRMAKSLGNFYTLRDIESRGFNPLLLRLILIKTHYRQILNFKLSDFKEAKSIAGKFINFLVNLEFIEKDFNNNINAEIKGIIKKYREKFIKNLDSDLNISLSLMSIYKFVNEINIRMDLLNVNNVKLIKKFINEIDQVLGFINPLYEEYLIELQNKINKFQIKKILMEREIARRKKDYKKADELRKEILSIGLIIEDTKHGYILKIK